MEVILTEDIPKLGNAGDVVRVKAGYGRNYLLPQGKALLATKGRVKDLEHKLRVIEEKIKKTIKEHEDVALRLGKIEIVFAMQAGDEGKLFGSVTSSDITVKLKEQGFDLDRRKISLEEPIKAVGDYEVELKLHREVMAKIKVKVTAAE